MKIININIKKKKKKKKLLNYLIFLNKNLNR